MKFPIALVVALLCVGCGTRDTFPRHHHVGNVYEVIGKLCVIGDRLKDEEMETIEGWRAHAEQTKKPFTQLHLGTKVKIVSIEKITDRSWNGGITSRYDVKVAILTPELEGKRFDANHLMYGQYGFGDNGSNLVTLKLVSTGSPK
jgi:hypothetical protein